MNTTLLPEIEQTLNQKITPVNGYFNPAGGNLLVKTKNSETYFLKYGTKSRIYTCEANGLNELRKTNTIRLPELISVDQNYILTEYIEPRRTSSLDFFMEFGISFGKMHLYTGRSFGFYEDNFIGNNPQKNIPRRDEMNDWVSFYFNNRLLYQYKLAEQNGYISPKLKKGFHHLEISIERILQGSQEVPTLLHGDLWSGNFLCDSKGKPVLIDPAVYYGHREADLAMTKLFGGFHSSFYEAYLEEYPLKDGWQYRENIYKLYHVLNHLNLFGTSYLREAEMLMEYYS